MLCITLSLFFFGEQYPKYCELVLRKSLLFFCRFSCCCTMHRSVLNVYRNLFMRFLGAIVAIVLRQIYDINSMLNIGCLFRKTSVLAISPSIYHRGSYLASKPSSPTSRHSQAAFFGQQNHLEVDPTPFNSPVIVIGLLDFP